MSWAEERHQATRIKSDRYRSGGDNDDCVIAVRTIVLRQRNELHHTCMLKQRPRRQISINHVYNETIRSYSWIFYLGEVENIG